MYQSDVTRGGILVEVYFILFPPPPDIFAFLKLPPLTQPPLPSYSASESLVAMRGSGAWVRAPATRAAQYSS